MDCSLALEKTDYLTRIYEYAHNHTREIEIALRIIEGIGAAFLLIGLVVLDSHIIITIASGVAIVAFVEITLFALDVLGILAIDPKKHVFQTMSVGNSRLYYEGDLPVLKIRADTSYDAGHDHGYLAAHQITRVIARMNVLSFLGYISTDKKILKQLEEVKKSIPKQYMQELQGLVDGVNKRLKEDSWWPKKYTIEDAIKIHMLPDLMHLALAPNMLFGCSAIIGKDEKTGATGVARNLDWPGLGVGRYTILRDIKIGDGPQLLEPTIPGCVGTITGLNKKLFVSINVTEPKNRIDDVKVGIPSLFLNRLILENCETLADVEGFIDYSNPEKRPAVPYHMFVADREGGSFYHFLQGDKGETYVRPYDKEADTPLFTLNCRHATDQMPTTANTMYYGSTRFTNIQQVWKKSSHLPLSERLKLVVKAPGVNNPMTVHSILWMKDHLIISFDNSFAATGQKCVVFLDQQFENREN